MQHFLYIYRRESFLMSENFLKDEAEKSQSFDPTSGLDQSELLECH